MNRFFVDECNISDESVIIEDKDDIKHIKNVLRLKENDKIEISNGKDDEYIVQVKNITDEFIKTDIIEKTNKKRESNISISLYQGYPKASKMENIVQKSTELGVKEIIPVLTDRAIVKINNKKKEKKKLERFNKIVSEAAKQSKRGVIPKVDNILSFKEMVEKLKADNDKIIVPYEDENKIGIKEILKTTKEENISIIIGPEGGFSSKEIDKLKEIGGHIVSLGPRILRTETAGPALISIIMYELGDVGVI